jgi:hypothetical protein
VALAEWPNLQQQRGKAEAIAADIAKRRADMAPPTPDPANVADAILKSELRTMLRTSSRADRLRLARDNNEFAIAALTAPPVLSGFGGEPDVPGQPSDLEIVRTTFQQRNFTELYAGLELRDEALAVVNMAIKSATDQILEDAGIAESEIGRLTSKADDADVDPNNLPKITRQQLNEWSAKDPGRAASEMRRVWQGQAQLVDALT